MATLATTHPTLMDVVKSYGADGQTELNMVEMLSEKNEILDDMVWKEGNLVTGHLGVIRTGLPAPTWRKLNGGVQPSKSNYRQITMTCGMLEAYSEPDKKLADLNGNTNAFRLAEARGHIEGMSQELADSLFYADEANAPEEITGFSKYYNSLSAESGENILRDGTVDGTDNTSIWLVCWGRDVHGIYPKGMKAGLTNTDLGEVTVENIDGNGGRMQAYRSHFTWDCGLWVGDWRQVVRININAEDLVSDAATGPKLLDLMMDATNQIGSLASGTPVFYANRRTIGFFKKQAMSKVSNQLTIETITRPNGLFVPTPMFMGIPIKRCDAITNNETGVS